MLLRYLDAYRALNSAARRVRSRGLAGILELIFSLRPGWHERCDGVG